VKRFVQLFAGLAFAGCFLSGPTRASSTHFWRIVSPDHEQTFAYGTEQSRIFTERGRDKHLALLLNFTNDPYVDRQNPRLYDNFTFSFPNVILGKDGRTFYYRGPGGETIPVARKHAVFLGTEIRLLPNAALKVAKPHGYLTLTLIIADRLPVDGSRDESY
jgi:hypothetical protein